MRQIYVVNAVQCVVSAAHPEGVYSVIPGYPKTFDSRNYSATDTNPDGDPARALEVADAEFFKVRSDMLLANNRALWGVTLEKAGGEQMRHAQKGALPATYPGPDPEPEPEPEPESEPEPEPEN